MNVLPQRTHRVPGCLAPRSWKPGGGDAVPPAGVRTMRPLPGARYRLRACLTRSERQIWTAQPTRHNLAIFIETECNGILVTTQEPFGPVNRVKDPAILVDRWNRAGHSAHRARRPHWHSDGLNGRDGSPPQGLTRLRVRILVHRSSSAIIAKLGSASRK